MAISGRMRVEVFMRDGFACVYCGSRGEGVSLHVDHVVPRNEGGPDSHENYVTACQRCNLGKGRRSLLAAIPFEVTKVHATGRPGDYDEERIVAVEFSPADIARKPWIRSVLLLVRVAEQLWNLDAERVGILARILVADVESAIHKIGDLGFTPSRIVDEMAWLLGRCPESVCSFLRNLGYWETPLNGPEAAAEIAEFRADMAERKAQWEARH